MLTNAGAIAFGIGDMYTRQKNLHISLGSLSTFVAFTGAGAINNTGTYNGNWLQDLLTISLATATVNGTIFPAGYTPETASVIAMKIHSDF
jgi:hypothetical protein